MTRGCGGRPRGRWPRWAVCCVRGCRGTGRSWCTCCAVRRCRWCCGSGSRGRWYGVCWGRRPRWWRVRCCGRRPWWPRCCWGRCPCRRMCGAGRRTGSGVRSGLRCRGRARPPPRWCSQWSRVWRPRCTRRWPRVFPGRGGASCAAVVASVLGWGAVLALLAVADAAVRGGGGRGAAAGGGAAGASRAARADALARDRAGVRTGGRGERGAAGAGGRTGDLRGVRGADWCCSRRRRPVPGGRGAGGARLRFGAVRDRGGHGVWVPRWGGALRTPPRWCWW